jgi:hypothetical protein
MELELISLIAILYMFEFTYDYLVHEVKLDSHGLSVAF